MAYHARSLRGLAITQMVIGALMIVLAIASIFAVHHWSSRVGFGIWIGIWVSSARLSTCDVLQFVYGVKLLWSSKLQSKMSLIK